jgi:dolichol-phosphate mannosyltransferase
MLKKWEEGTNIVYARRLDRKDSFFKRVTAQLYYRFLDLISDVKIPRNVGDFRLIDRKVLNTLNKCREKARYFRGMVAWTGFSHAFIDFNRPNRTAGVTGYTWKKMFKLAFDGMTGFSMFPLKIAAYAGLFVIITGSLMFLYITCDALINQVDYPLFKWLVTVVYIFMGVQFVLMWFLGEYIGRMHDQQKGRPLYVIADEINMEKASPVEA